MSIGNRMRGLGESVYYLDGLKPKMDELMGDISYELNHEVGKRKLLVRLDGFGEEYKPQIETLMDEELPVGYRMEYDPFPLGFIRLDFLEGTFNQYIDTGIIKNDKFSIKITYQQLQNRRTSLLGYIYTNEGTTYGVQVYVENHNFVGQLRFRNTIDIVIYPKPENWEPYEKKTLEYTVGERSARINGTSVKTGYMGGAPYQINNPLNRSIWLFAINGWTKEGVVKIYDFSLSDVGKSDDLHFIPALDSTGTPCMFDLVTKQPFYNQGTGQFIAGLTMKQALNLAKLPTPSDDNNKLTISLPKEATLVQHNQEVEAALNTAAEKGWNIPVQYRGAGEEKEIINKYTECKTVDDVLAINANYKNDLTEDGEWIYPLSNITTMPNLMFDTNSKIKVFNTHVNPSCNFKNQTFNTSKVEVITFINYKAPQKVGWFLWGTGHLREVNIDFSGCSVIEMIGYNNKKLTRINSDFSRLITTDWAFFHAAQLDKTTTLRILNTIPAWSDGATHKLNLHSHIDNKTDEAVIAAIADAEAKGWKVATTWNGTPTNSATYSLRRQTIYAKVETLEHPDGRTEPILVWCHYATDPEGMGYTEFASIEEAEEYFNIKTEIVE